MEQIKNIIFDVGMVLVNWDPHAAFQELCFDVIVENIRQMKR